jgi:Flp pilus assembly protein TadG
MLSTTGRSKSPERRGATVVEFAMVAPVLFCLVFGIIEFGRFVMLHQVAITATREGARKAALATTTTTAQVDTIVRSRLAVGGVPSSFASDVAKTIITVTDSAGNDLPSTDLNTYLAAGAPITVDVQMSFAELTWLPGDYFGLASVNVSAATTMERE